MSLIFNRIRSGLGRFARDESGAVTADWVVLVAGIVGFALSVIAVLGQAFEPNATNIGTELVEYTIDTSFD